MILFFSRGSKRWFYIVSWMQECCKYNSCHLSFICIAHSIQYLVLLGQSLKMVLQATQLPKEPFQEPLTYGGKTEVICILVPMSYIYLTYSSYRTYDTLASRRQYYSVTLIGPFWRRSVLLFGKISSENWQILSLIW